MTAYRIGHLRRMGLPALAVVGLALWGCKPITLGSQTTASGTNAPVAGFQNPDPGTEEEFIFNVGRRTHFAEGSAALDDTARVTLDKQAEWLRRHPSWLIKLQGFSDDPGSPNQNKTLSKKRADAVMNYLASRGVAKSRMWSKGYGRQRIVRDCPELACKSQNRRVVTNLRNERDT